MEEVIALSACPFTACGSFIGHEDSSLRSMLKNFPFFTLSACYPWPAARVHARPVLLLTAQGLHMLHLPEHHRPSHTMSP